jgi:predicted nucleotidyltransferase
MPLALQIDRERIAEFCHKWQIKEFAIFGSALGDDFRPDSDVDVLVELREDAPWDAFDWVTMIDELQAIFGRDVDLVEKTAIRNPFRRRHILSHHEVVYAA